MTTAGNGRFYADITRDLLADNDDAVAGRLPLLVECRTCGHQEPQQIGTLSPGRWAVDHLHGLGWAVRRVVPDGSGNVEFLDDELAEQGLAPQRRAIERPAAHPRPPADVAALAAAFASTLAGAGR